MPQIINIDSIPFKTSSSIVDKSCSVEINQGSSLWTFWLLSNPKKCMLGELSFVLSNVKLAPLG